MKKLLFFVLLVAVLAGASIAHEQDILRACKEKGNSGVSMWTAKIKCEEL